jgi:hypothetical protein
MDQEIRHRTGDGVHHLPSHAFGDFSQGASLWIRQAQPRRQMGAEDAILW